MYIPEGIGQVLALNKSPWIGDLSTDIPYIQGLGIDIATYRYVEQGSILDTLGRPDITVMASEGFVACSAFLMRNTKTGVDTFSHVWPGESDYRLYEYLKKADATGDVHEAVFIYGGISRSTGIEHDFANNRLENIRARAISVDTGRTWWKAVFDRVAGDVTVLRREPDRSMLRFHIFES